PAMDAGGRRPLKRAASGRRAESAGDGGRDGPPRSPGLRYPVIMTLSSFHPAVRAWFERKFDRPTSVQAEAWPVIKEGGHTLLAAPTGSGKTLAAFLAAIDDLVREGESQSLPDEARVLYISPLKARSNDINKNLDEPLAGIRDEIGRAHV